MSYATALAEGSLLERARLSNVSGASGIGRVSALGGAGAAKLLNGARRREWLFREPLRFFGVEAGAFDLVHAHVFSVGYRGAWPPIVMSNSVAVEALYQDGLAWSSTAISVSRAFEKAVTQAARVDHTTYRRRRAARLVAFTEHLQHWWANNGVAPTRDVDVVPCSVAVQEFRELRQQPHIVGFFAGAPWIKGLDRAFTAFSELRTRRAGLELWVIGSSLTKEWQYIADAPGVRWVGRRPRVELLQQVLPELDVLLHPTRFDGLPLSVLEAMSSGVPIITSNYRAMPEVVGSAGRVASTASELVTALEQLLDADENAKASRIAWRRQRDAFSPEAVLPRLLESYGRAISS